MKVDMVRRGEHRSPRIIYGSGGTTKSDIEFSEYDFVGGSPTVPKYDTDIKIYYMANNPKCSKTTTGEALRYCYILWFLRTNQIGYIFYQGHERTWQEVIRDRVGNCCDLSQLVDVLAGQTGMDSICGDPITTRRYNKGSILYNGTLYYHIYNELMIDGEWKEFDASNYALVGRATTLADTGGISYYDPIDDPCP